MITTQLCSSYTRLLDVIYKQQFLLYEDDMWKSSRCQSHTCQNWRIRIPLSGALTRATFACEKLGQKHEARIR